LDAGQSSRLFFAARQISAHNQLQQLAVFPIRLLQVVATFQVWITCQCGEFLAQFGAPLLVWSTAGRHFDEEVTQFPAQWWVPVQFYARYP
jgi:hypothetical protein